MRVFISWSGELSNKIGEKFRNWLPGVIQAVSPYYTPADIVKGARWEASLANELETSEVGMFLVTRENLNSHWMLFEAGALAKRLDKSRVCPILFGVEHTHLPAPLRSFQITSFKEDEMRKLILDTNKALGERKLVDSVVNKTFDMWWPDLNDDVTKILQAHKHVGENDEPNEKEMITEILELSRLTARRSDSGEINPKVIIHLIRTINNVHGHIKVRDTPERVMKALEDIRSSLLYFQRRVRRDFSAEAEELIQALDFEVNFPDLEGDEIPF